MSSAKVYVPDPEWVWLRGTVESVTEDSVSITIENPDSEQKLLKTFSKETLLKLLSSSGHKTNDLRIIDLLPLQNVESLQRAGGTPDMTSLNHLHEAAIMDNLRLRFIQLLPYTYTGNICIAVNPYQWLDIYGEETRERYRWIARSELPPHVYGTSAAAYKGIRDQKINQSILVSGESGAGKTETVKIMMSHLASVSSLDSNATIQRVLESNPLLESFGNAKTVRNDNSSRFGKFIQLELDQDALLKGSHCTTYLLEKSRVVGIVQDERNYHIYYQLLSAPMFEKEKYGITNETKEDFCYLNQGDVTISKIEGKSDETRFKMTINALQLIGCTPAEVNSLFSAISGILHLGQISFKADGNDQERAIISNRDALEKAANLIGCDPQKAAQALTLRTMTTRNETYQVPLKPSQSIDARDALAKELYQRMFDWLVEKINLNTSSGPAATYFEIGLLDIFGFECFKVNGFEQLCINFANEKLQQRFTQDVFKKVQEEYEEEHIYWSHIDFHDNAEVLELIEGRMGVISMLNEQSVTPGGNDERFTSKVTTLFKDCPHFIEVKRSRVQFAVRHYAGVVTYTSNNFVEKNKDTLQEDLVHLLSGSLNLIIRGLFQTLEVADDDSQANKPTRKRRGSLIADSVATKFKTQLNVLMETISSTAIQYVRCIKPNSLKSPTTFNHQAVVEQLRCAGVIDAIKISRAAFPNRLQHQEFIIRFRVLVNMKTHKSWQFRQRSSQEIEADLNSKLQEAKQKMRGKSVDKFTPQKPDVVESQKEKILKQQREEHQFQAKEICSILVEDLIGKNDPVFLRKLAEGSRDLEDLEQQKLAIQKVKFQIGETKIYFRAEILENLEEQRTIVLNRKAVILQSTARCWMLGRSFQRFKKACIQIQTQVRRFLALKHFVYSRLMAIRLQCSIRKLIARKKLITYRRDHKATVIQSWFRCTVQLRKFKKLQNAAKKIQATVRMFQARHILPELREQQKLENQLNVLKKRLEEEQRARAQMEHENQQLHRRLSLPPQLIDGNNYAPSFMPMNQDLMGESEKMLKLLQAEIAKLRAENHTQKESLDKLKTENNLLRQKHETYGASYATLNQHCKTLAKKNDAYEQEIERFTQTNADLKEQLIRAKEELKVKQSCYRAEVTARIEEQKTIQQLMELYEKNISDQNILTEMKQIIGSRDANGSNQSVPIIFDEPIIIEEKNIPPPRTWTRFRNSISSFFQKA